MKSNYDVIIIGLGAMGSAALYQAAKAGARVLGIDRYAPPHTYGSTHAETRMTRLAVGEGARYVPFVARSHQIWRDLEAQTGRTLFYQAGGYVIAPKQNAAAFHGEAHDFVEATRQIAQQQNIPHDYLSGQQLRHKHPQFRVSDHEHALFEPSAGLLMCERAVQTQLEEARKLGATIHTNEPISAWHQRPHGIEVTTDQGRYTADKAILTTGAWITDFLPRQMHGQLNVYRQVVYWFEVEDGARFAAEHCPFTIWIGETPAQFFCSFAIVHDGIPGLKVMTEQYVETTTPATVQRAVTQAEIDHAYHTLFASKIVGIKPNIVHAEVCLYTNTADHHFIIDTHPTSEDMIIVSACSGHGFKHSAAIGQAVSQLALEGESDLDLTPFKSVISPGR